MSEMEASGHFPIEENAKDVEHELSSESSSFINSSSESSCCASSTSESSDNDEISELKLFVPLEIQDKLKNYLVKKLVPDLMNYLSTKTPTICGIPTKYYRLEKLDYPPSFLRSAFKEKEDLYDLYKMARILELPYPRYFKELAKVSVGAAIRISKAIAKEEHAENLKQIVKEWFTPEENPDLTETNERNIFMSFLDSASESSASEGASSESSDDDDDISELELYVPLEIQDKLKNYLVEKLVPDLMNNLSTKTPTIRGIPTKYYRLEKLDYPPYFLRSAFEEKEDLYDLYKMARIFDLPYPTYLKSQAKVSVGAAIRISKVIAKEEHADKLRQIVKECFTPEENPDLTETNERKIFMICLNSPSEALVPKNI